MKRCRFHRLASADLTEAVVSRSPYSLIYRIAGEVLRVVAVAHHKRGPSYWVRRS